MPSGFFYLQSLDQPISNIGRLVKFYCYCFIEIPAFHVHSKDPDQMPHFAASDQGLHCLPNVPFVGG